LRGGPSHGGEACQLLCPRIVCTQQDVSVQPAARGHPGVGLFVQRKDLVRQPIVDKRFYILALLEQEQERKDAQIAVLVLGRILSQVSRRSDGRHEPVDIVWPVAAGQTSALQIVVAVLQFEADPVARENVLEELEGPEVKPAFVPARPNRGSQQLGKPYLLDNLRLENRQPVLVVFEIVFITVVCARRWRVVEEAGGCSYRQSGDVLGGVGCRRRGGRWRFCRRLGGFHTSLSSRAPCPTSTDPDEAC